MVVGVVRSVCRSLCSCFRWLLCFRFGALLYCGHVHLPQSVVAAGCRFTVGTSCAEVLYVGHRQGSVLDVV